MILQEMEWPDVLRVRGVCRRLSVATRATAVCRQLVEERLVEEFQPLGHRLDQPITAYSSNELECRFLHWKEAELAFLNREGLPRHSVMPTTDSACTFLVPGGRWFLVAFHDGEVKYFDLHKPEQSPSTLIPPSFQDTFPSRVRLRVDIDHTTEYLEFNLALYLTRWPDPLSGPTECFVQIWRIRLHGMALLAIKIVSFPIPKESFEFYAIAVDLLGRFFSYISPRSFGAPPTGVPAVVTIDWTLIDPLAYDRILVDNSMVPSFRKKIIFPFSLTGNSNLRLLPDSRLLVHGSRRIDIYDLDSIDEILEFDSNPFSLKPTPCLWTVHFEDLIFGQLHISPVFHCRARNVSRVVIYGMSSGEWAIDTTGTGAGNVEPQVVHLHSWEDDWDCTLNGSLAIGHRHVVMLGNDFLALITYTKSGYRKIVETISRLDGEAPSSQIDEENGILVFRGSHIFRWTA